MNNDNPPTPDPHELSALESRGRAAGVYWNATDLMSHEFPDPRWAVPGLVAEGLNLLVGSPKLGKSWLCLGLGVAIASGGVALGKVRVEQGSVLYAALEDTPRRLQGRLRAVLSGVPVPATLSITTSLPRGAEMTALVGEWLEHHPDARLVVIDVLRKVTPRSDGRSGAYEADYDAMGALKALADAHSVAVIAVHHTRKTTDEGDVFNEVSGSTGLTGAADAILIAKRARNTAEAVLHVTGRDVTEHEYALSWHAESCTWSLLEEPVALATDGRYSPHHLGLPHPSSSVGAKGHRGRHQHPAEHGAAERATHGQGRPARLGRRGPLHPFIVSVSPVSPVSHTGPD